MAPAIFAGRTKCNDLITIADFPAEADRASILMVNGGLKAKPVELRRFGGQHPMDTETGSLLSQLCTFVQRLLRDSGAQGTGFRHDRAAHVGACYRQGLKRVRSRGAQPRRASI